MCYTADRRGAGDREAFTEAAGDKGQSWRGQRGREWSGWQGGPGGGELKALLPGTCAQLPLLVYRHEGLCHHGHRPGVGRECQPSTSGCPLGLYDQPRWAQAGGLSLMCSEGGAGPSPPT